MTAGGAGIRVTKMVNFLIWVSFTSLIVSRQVSVLQADAETSPRIVFNAPTSGQTVSGRTFAIEVEVFGIQLPDEAKGILYLDNGKLLEMRQSHLTVNMDGAGGLAEGLHSLRLVLVNTNGETISSGSVTFVKEGSPEDLAGPFHDSRYDDETLQEVNICSCTTDRIIEAHLCADGRRLQRPCGVSSHPSAQTR